MATRPRTQCLAGIGALLALCGAGSGCQSTVLPHGLQGKSLAQTAPASSRLRNGETPGEPDGEIRLAAAVAGVITPSMELYWTVESPQLRPSRKLAATLVVGPDGRVQLGPYGPIRLAGLTPAQARRALEKHLAHYLSKPRVTLVPGNPPVERSFAWQTAPDDQPGPREKRPGVAWRTTRPGTPPTGIVVATTEWESPSPATAPAKGIIPAGGSSEPYYRSMSANDADAADQEVLPSPRRSGSDAQAGELHPPGLLQPPAGPEGNGHFVPRELHKVSLPPYIIEPPDILLVESSEGLKQEPIRGQHLVRPDGTISLGIYGDVYVNGMTLEQARAAVTEVLKPRVKTVTVKDVSVDVLAYNSKVYYVITDGGGYGEQVVRLPITGNETVLDAISLITGLPPVASKKDIWVARATPGGFGTEKILPVDYIGMTKRGSAATNYQLMPGDRVYVQSEKLRRIDSGIAKFLSPIERVLGVTLLGSETVNSITGRSGGTSR